jgi:hypothetical protein
MRRIWFLLLLSACNTRPEPREGTRGTPGDTDGIGGDAAGGDTEGADCTVTGCTHLDTDCASGVCNAQTGVCDTVPLTATTPCGAQSTTTCGASLRCDGSGHCASTAAADGTVCEDCNAGAGNCGGCRSFSCTDRCGNDLIDAEFGEECDGDSSDACPGRCRPDCTCLLRDCRDVLRMDEAVADGAHTVRTEDNTEVSVYCDMTTDGGGWTLLATISGAGAEAWNAELPWTDPTTFGTAESPWLDLKSPLYAELDVHTSELLLVRRYDGAVAARSILAQECLDGAQTLGELFATATPTPSCGPSDITVLEHAPVGLASADYEEGTGALGLGNAATNGLCWLGEDTTVDNGLSAHLYWNGVTDGACALEGHAGGVGVYAHTGTTYTDTDIGPTAWLAGTDAALTSISLFVRDTTTRCATDAECEAASSDTPSCDLVSGLCYQPGACDDTDPALAPCHAPTTCMENEFAGFTNCQGCAVDEDCRAGETCLDLGVGISLGCVSFDFLPFP